MDNKSAAKDLFARAHRLSIKAREAFLAEACGDDAELRLEVQRMLVDSEKADSFFADDEAATLIPEIDTTYTEAEGDEIGPYTLRQQIGEGGFGTVWMAEQSEPISRMVALKVIKAGMDTKQVLARFEAERQAVAMMDHPNIAKVLDAGATSTGRPYFAMELVKGIPITEFCDQQNFGSRRRLELFKDVCAAVNHAHQKGIIHRDLKPSNLMVTLAADVPVVKVIDFGIAKATQNKLTEKTLFTRFEQFLGTPVYMSPEQAAMSAIDIDTRSDIYSLGVLLYELLAGAPPFDQKSLLSAGYDEMRRIIAEDEPPKPSTRCTQTQANTATGTGSKARKSTINPTALKGELDWIVMKAIEKDRTRRYETANAFAADIGRFLEDEPVLAAAPGAGYKFKKFARRNKAAFSVAAAMVVLLLAGIAATSWQAVRATAAEKKATETLALVAAESDAKTAALEDAEAISKFLTDMFVTVRPGEEKGGIDLKVTEVLGTAVKQLDENESIPPARRAKLQASLGSTYYALGLYPQAIDLQEQVRDYRMTTLDPEHPDTLRAMGSLAGSYHSAGRRDEALEMFEEKLKLSRKVNGPEHPSTLTAITNLATSYHYAGRRDEALEMDEEMLALSRKVSGPEHPDTLFKMHNLAHSYFAANRRDEALEMREEVLALRRKVLGDEHPETLGAMGSLALSYRAAGRRDEAIEMQEEVLKLRRQVLGPEHPDTLSVMGYLANSYRAAGRRDEALEMREEALTLSRKVLGDEHPDTLEAMNTLANTYAEAGRWDEVIEMREEVLALRREALGDEHPDTPSVMTTLANTYAEAGRWDEAIEMQEELALRRKALGDEHPDTLKLGVFYRDAGKAALNEEGKVAEAVALLEQAQATRAALLAKQKHPEPQWTVLKPTETKSEGGATLTVLDDHSILASGVNPDRDTYTVVAPADLERVTAFRLEALPHESLPKSGPGRHKGTGNHGIGNFHVNELRVSAEEDPLTLNDIWVEYDEIGQAAKVIDGRIDHFRGWGNYPRVGQGNTAVISASPTSLGGAPLTFDLYFSIDHPQHNLGRFRLSVTGDENALGTTRLKALIDSFDHADLDASLALAYARNGETGKAEATVKGAMAEADTAAAMSDLIEALEAKALSELAAAARAQARPRVEELLAADPSDQTALELMADLVLAESAPEWTVLEPTEMKSEGGTTLEVLDDHSIFASGVNPEQETYTVTAPLDGDVPTGIRLETIPDSRLPGGGAGRGGANGAIILTEFVPELVPPSGEPALPLAIRSAWVDWAQPGYSAIERTFDGNDQSYWAVNPKFAEPHTAIYALESSSLEKEASSQLRIHVHFDHRTYRNSSLGRFRLSVTDDPRAVDLVAAQDISDPTTRLAAAYALAGQTNEAVAWFDRALKALRAASELYPDGPRGIEMRELLVKALVALGREEEAREVRRALAALPAPVSKDSPVVRSVIVAPSSEWSWLHPTDGTDPKESDADFHQTFPAPTFDDAAWQTGKDSAEAGGGFGYGDDGFTGVDIGTPGVADAEGKRSGKSAYFRHRFTTTKEHAHLELRCQRDDGLILYLDGKEVARDNMEEGEEAYALPAARAVGGQDEMTTRRIPLQDLTLPPGEHILSISLHNTEAPSSDLRIGGITLVEVETPEAK